MKQYIGIKVVAARPMTRGDYNIFRGWQIPADEDPADEGCIALANMTLAAWDKGVGSCIMGAINKPALTELLGIEEPQKLAFMVAFGYPAHKAHIVPLTAETGVKYYLDENRDYCVPKRSKEEIAKYL